MKKYKSLQKIKSQISIENKYIASIAIRVKNEIKGLKSFWESIEKQSCFRFLEITFLDSGSTDGTLLFLESLNCNIYTIESEDFNFGDSCNLMMELTNADYVFLFSGHVILESNTLIEEAYNFINGRHISGYFRQIPNEIFGCSIYDRTFLKYKFPSYKSDLPILIKGKNSFSNAASIINRFHWKRVCFNEVIYGEDEIWVNEILNLGENIYYFHKLNVMHSHNDTSSEIRKRINKAALVKFPNGVNLIRLVCIFLKVFLAIFISSGRFFDSINYAYSHSAAYADIKRNY